MEKYKPARTGCKDIWNSFMAIGADFRDVDFPFCPTTATEIPDKIITWEEAKTIYKSELRKGNHSFHENSFVCFYVDDYKFDGPRGIWHDSSQFLKVVRHFGGMITPDFSTYQDFPDPLKRFATYRMRLMGYWAGTEGISVINNVRWGTDESWNYCFRGIPKDSIVAIGTVGGSPRKIIDRERFENGLKRMVDELHPHTILVYGSANYLCFKELEDRGIKVIAYPSKTSEAYKKAHTL